MRKTIIDQMLTINGMQESFTKCVDIFVEDNIKEIITEIINNGGESIEIDDSETPENYIITLKNMFTGNHFEKTIVVDRILVSKDLNEILVSDSSESIISPFAEINTDLQLDILNHLFGEFNIW